MAIDETTGRLLVDTVSTGVTVKRAIIDAASDAAAGNEIIAGVSDKRICVLGICLLAEEAVDVTFYSGPADTGTALTGPIPVGDRGGFVLPMPADPSMPWLRTEPSEALTIHLSAAWRCGGWVVYCEGAA
ncbi:MAG: hypothetical protein JXQ75_06850 [Phycisphaerae bacterium]|nr:hypothetical protein [Phycisphaerae bacterium]